MEQSTSVEKALRDEVARLGLELEQANVALEDAHTQVTALVDEAERLRRAVATLERMRTISDTAAAHARQMVGAAGKAAERAQTTTTEGLRSALEETAVLTEELQAANEELLAANEELDGRVAQRTLELGRANAELERINTDLNRRIEAETAARTKAQADLFQMQKLEAIGQLTGGIAHDFNNLLMVIISGLQLLGTSHSDAQRERALRRTQEASWRAAELTRRLLAFARRQALHPERVDLHRQVESMRELLGQGLREDIDLRVELEPGIWPLEVDLGALELALLNLTVNARDAMPAGGSVRIEARNATMDRDSAAPRSIGAGDYVEIAIADTGTGMTPSVLEKVFEPFFTTKSAGTGTGLGLAQVLGFAQQSGGTAWVVSEQGKGTIVRLLLPRSTRAVEPVREQPSVTVRCKPPGHLRVLVVEDEPAVADALVDMLVQLGHRGTSVPTVAAALARLSGREPTDLVVSDVLLPGGDSGLDLARAVRERNLGVPVILTSGYGGAMTQRLSTMNLPFLCKPYHIDALRQAIEAAAAVPSTEQLPAMAGRG